LITILGVALLLTGWLAGSAARAADCSFRVNPDRFLGREAQVRQRVFVTAKAFGAFGRTHRSALALSRRNFIDEEIFGKLERLKVASAPLTTDEEFLRRIYLDLTARPPTLAEAREFLADTSADKRDVLLDRLLYSPPFGDRWTMWLGDLLQNVTFPANFDRQYDGRNAFYEWIVRAIAREKSLRDIAYEAIALTGNSYNADAGGVNFSLNGLTPMGPIQDTYDNAMRSAVSTFLGLSHFDCLLCHSGRNRLDQVSLWGAQATRIEAMKMAAFFTRISMVKPRLANTEFYYNSYDVTDRAAGNYDLNTNYGNRPNREPIGGARFLTPEYYGTLATPSGDNWRASFAGFLVDDPMFARNLVNRLWKEMFGMALAEPLDSLDPLRLDPANPPPAPWTLQASHPELLERLAQEFRNLNYNLREFLRLLVQSSAYQLSSRYDGDWKIDYVPLFARHYPRRLEGEEIHDSITVATGIIGNYTLRGLANTGWAMQMPEPLEPRSNGAAVNFMRPFLRGNRDSQFRSQDGSILQQLALMNDTFLLSRIRAGSSPTLDAVSRIQDNDAAVDDLFLLFLSRRPNERERAISLSFLARAGNRRNDYLEDLAWVLLNKVDFLFTP